MFVQLSVDAQARIRRLPVKSPRLMLLLREGQSEPEFRVERDYANLPENDKDVVSQKSCVVDMAELRQALGQICADKAWIVIGGSPCAPAVTWLVEADNKEAVTILDTVQSTTLRNKNKGPVVGLKLPANTTLFVLQHS